MPEIGAMCDDGNATRRAYERQYRTPYRDEAKTTKIRAQVLSSARRTRKEWGPDWHDKTIVRASAHLRAVARSRRQGAG